MNTGIQFESLTNKDVGTYDYKYTAVLTSLARRLGVSPSFTISLLRVIVVSDGCQVASLAFQPGEEALSKSYLIGSGGMQIDLPTPSQSPSCGYSLAYQFATAPQLNYALVRQAGGDFKLKIDISDYQMAN